MEIILVTGSAGLIGSEVVRYYAHQNKQVVGIDNNMRKEFFGEEASTGWNRKLLEESYPKKYHHYAMDIRDYSQLEKIFQEYQDDIRLIVHTAAQPSHDWAASNLCEDFTVNANGTLVLLELTRKYCPETVFIFTSTNKAYGDNPNYLPLIEQKTRWKLAEDHKYYEYGIDETMSID